MTQPIGHPPGVPFEPEPRTASSQISLNWTPGDRRDFERLYLETYAKVTASLRFMVGDAAEDCAQDAYRRAFRSWDTWKPDAPPEAWIHRIAFRTAANYRTHEKLRSITEVVRRLGRPAEVDPSDVPLRNDLAAALNKLPQKLSAALVLRHLHGYSNREIGAALGIPERTVASRLIAARRRLVDELGPDWAPRASTEK